MSPRRSEADTAIERLTAELMRLPGIGRKSAQRLVFHLLKRPAAEAQALAAALLAVRERVRACSVCFNFAEEELCAICADPGRDRSRICVVEEPANVGVLERSGAFRGLYHVLGGVLSPLSGVGSEDLHVRELVERVRGAEPPVAEVVLATNPTVEGEATAIHVAAALKPAGVHVTRIAQGLPVGADLEYTDDVTLLRALQGRRDVD